VRGALIRRRDVSATPQPIAKKLNRVTQSALARIHAGNSTAEAQPLRAGRVNTLFVCLGGRAGLVADALFTGRVTDGECGLRNAGAKPSIRPPMAAERYRSLPLVSHSRVSRARVMRSYGDRSPRSNRTPIVLSGNTTRLE
jgi:hypothetical protein